MTDRYRAALETVAQWDEWAAQRLRELDAPPKAPAEGLGDALERIARSRKSVNGLCVMCGAMDSQHHRPGCVHAIAIAALAEWDKAGIYLDPPSIAALRAYVAQPTAPAEGLCMARSGEPCSDPVNHHQPAAPAEGLLTAAAEWCKANGYISTANVLYAIEEAQTWKPGFLAAPAEGLDR